MNARAATQFSCLTYELDFLRQVKAYREEGRTISGRPAKMDFDAFAAGYLAGLALRHFDWHGRQRVKAKDRQKLEQLINELLMKETK